jgi:hypothetical protein
MEAALRVAVEEVLAFVGNKGETISAYVIVVAVQTSKWRTSKAKERYLEKDAYSTLPGVHNVGRCL